MAYEDTMVDAVMAKYQGLERKQLVDCADAIKAKLGDERATEVGDEKILEKAARTLQAKMRKEEKEKAAAVEQKAKDAEDKAVESAVETAVVPAGDYVAVKMTLGVPESLNHLDPMAADTPQMEMPEHSTAAHSRGRWNILRART